MDGAISRAPAGVSIESFSTGVAKATGTVVVIDVFRAFTTAAIVLRNGAERIVMVDDLEAALTPRRDGICRYCMGERGGLKPEGFDFGNSPAEVAEWDFTGLQSLLAGGWPDVEAIRAAILGLSPRGSTRPARTGPARPTAPSRYCAR